MYKRENSEMSVSRDFSLVQYHDGKKQTQSKNLSLFKKIRKNVQWIFCLHCRVAMYIFFTIIHLSISLIHFLHN